MPQRFSLSCAPKRVVLIALISSLAPFLTPSVAEASDCDALDNNLVSNCGFETGEEGLNVEGWTIEVADEAFGGVVTNEPDYANSGIGLMFVGTDAPGEELQLQAISAAVTVEPGATYAISVEAATLDNSGEFVSSEFLLALGVVGSQQFLQELQQTDVGYTQFSYEFVADSATLALGIGLGATANPTVLLDDVVVVKIRDAESPTPVPFMPMYLLLALSGLLALFGFFRVRASK